MLSKDFLFGLLQNYYEGKYYLKIPLILFALVISSSRYS